jgi:hypothetical protein
MCKRETVWAEPKYTLQVNVLVGDTPVTNRSIVLPRSYMLGNENPPSPDNLKTVLSDLAVLSAARDAHDLGDPAQHLCPGDVKTAWETLDADVKAKTQPTFCEEAPGGACENIAAAEADGNLLRVSNSASVVAEVDYEHVYYMNTKTPWIGNASVDAKLQADGTLTEGNIQANDQTWSTILSTIGGIATDVATVGAARYGAAATAASTTTTTTAPAPSGGNLMAAHVEVAEPLCESTPGWPVPKVASTVKTTKGADPKADKADAKPAAGGTTETTKKDASISYQFSVTATVYLHDHLKKDLCIGSDPACGCVPTPTGILDGSFTITKVDDSKGKDDPNTIKVSGQVVLPKADADKAAK